MGVVYLAAHRTTGERVALKTVRVPQAELYEGIRREIQALALLRHPGIVRTLEHGVEDGIPWYAMELCEGSTLGSQGSRSSGAAADESAWWTRTFDLRGATGRLLERAPPSSAGTAPRPGGPQGAAAAHRSIAAGDKPRPTASPERRAPQPLR